MAIFNQQVTAPAGYPGDPQVVVPFEPRRITLVLFDTGAGKTLEFSFDGSTDSVKLSTDSGFTRYECTQRARRIFVKGASAAVAQVIAEG